MNLSQKGENWLRFATTVLEHIENYAVPQYGGDVVDSPDVRSKDDCIKYMSKYLRRTGSERRGRIEELRDMVKIAHFAQYAFDFSEPTDEEKRAIEEGRR